MTTPESNNRRKLTNMLIDPRLQMLLFAPYLVTLVGFVITNLLIVRFVIATFGRLEVNGTAALDPSDIYYSLSMFSAVGLIAVSILGFALSLGISHRLLGPLYNIQRHVRRMKAGEYHHVITLRKGDRLVDLADDLNLVTARFNGLAGTPSPKP